MTDRNIDIDLIMALAEGSLPADEARALEESLSDDARVELAEQRLALALLSDSTHEGLSAMERSTLRAAVKSELNLEEEVAPAPTPATRWYWRALPALGAAAAIVFVVGIGIASLPSGNDSETADATAEADSAEEVDPNVPPESAMLQGARVDDEVARTEAPAATEATAETEAMAEASTTAATEAAAEAPASERDFGVPMVPDNLGDISLNDLGLLAAAVEEGAFRLLGFTPYEPFRLGDAATPQGLICWANVLEQEAFDSEIDYLGIAAIDGEPGEVYRVIQFDGTPVIYVFVGDDCATAAIVQP